MENEFKSDRVNRPCRIFINQKDRVFLIDTDTIIRCEEIKNSTVFYINDNKKLTIQKSLNQVADRLTKISFIRIHSNHLLNLKYLNRIPEVSEGIVELEDGTQLPVDSNIQEQLLKVFKEY